MSDQIPALGLIPELLRLGEGAKKYYWEIPKNEDEKKNKEQAINEFVKFFKSVPQLVEASPILAKDNLGANLMRIGITFGRMDEDPQMYVAAGHQLSRVRGETKILLTAGQVLSQLGEKHQNMKNPALGFLNSKIKSGWRWDKHSRSEAYMEREDALEIVGWALVGTPEWVTPDLTRIAVEAVVLPYCMDCVMIDNILFDMKKWNSVEPEEFASIYSEKACETLGTMIGLKPDLAESAYVFVEKAEIRAEKMCPEDLFPVVAMAAEQARDAICDAAGNEFAPERPLNNSTTGPAKDILAL